MKKIILFCLLAISLQATQLLDFNIYKRVDRVDVMLSFDSPFNGSVMTKKGDEVDVIILDNVTYNLSKTAEINDLILKDVQIYGKEDKVYVLFKTTKNIDIEASLSKNRYGLRLRAKPVIPHTTQQQEPESTITFKDTVSNTNTKREEPLAKSHESNSAQHIAEQIDEGEQTQEQSQDLLSSLKGGDIDYTRYAVVIGFMLAGVILLLFIKNRVSSKSKGWLFNSIASNKKINIISQQQIDMKNKVVTIEAEGFKYLVVITPNSATLLDKIGGDGVVSQSYQSNRIENSFEGMLKNSEERLNNFLGSNSKLEEYKDKASR